MTLCRVAEPTERNVYFKQMQNQPCKKAVIYARCSTDEKRQDVEIQLRELRRYCEAFGWQFDEFSEYDSGFKGEQPELQEVLKQIKHKKYDTLIVYSLDRFSRQTPSKVNRLLDELVEQDGVRFISRLEGIDSANDLTWNVVRPLFAYFANLFSKTLSEKIRAGIRLKREKGTYKGGRPKKALDEARLRQIVLNRSGRGWRLLAKLYNEGLPREQRISFMALRRAAISLGLV